MSKVLSFHVSYTSSKEISDICRPIMRLFTGNIFIYQRSIINPDTKKVVSNAYLCDHTEALDFFLSLPQEKREPAKYDYSMQRKFILMDYTQPNFTSIMQKKFNVNCMLSRDERIKPNEWEHIIIGSNISGITTINNYINNLGMIDKFASFFRSKAIKLITTACNNSFLSGRAMLKCSFGDTSNGPIAITNNYSVIPEPTHYYLTNKYSETIVVPQIEMRYLIMLSQGKGSKEIAGAYNVSSRTVENIIRIAKYRLACNTKSELLNIILNWKKSNAWVL